MCKFSSYNPIINFIFLVGAIVLGLIFIHPAFTICSVVLSSVLLATIKGRSAFGFIGRLIPLFLFVSLVNPLFNTYGQTVLFTYFNRPYTLEALFYGMALAAVFVSMLIWFASYNAIMTSDKFLYIFGRFAPTITLIFTMVLRFIPNYKRKTEQISTARKCVGKSWDGGSKSERLENGMTILGSLVSNALEGSIITADSMKSRGYGSGNRTRFSIYRFSARDVLLCLYMVVLFVIILVCSFNGGTYVTYTPKLYISNLLNPYTAVGIIAYFIFLITPSVINITEEIACRISISKI